MREVEVILISHVPPDFGPKSGGFEFIIKGKNLETASKVYLGIKRVPFSIADEETLLVSVPSTSSSSSGSVTILGVHSQSSQSSSATPVSPSIYNSPPSTHPGDVKVVTAAGVALLKGVLTLN